MPRDSQDHLPGSLRRHYASTLIGKVEAPIPKGRRKYDYSGLREHSFCDSARNIASSQFSLMLGQMGAATSSGTGTSRRFSFSLTRRSSAVTKNSKSAPMVFGSIWTLDRGRNTI